MRKSNLCQRPMHLGVPTPLLQNPSRMPHIPIIPVQLQPDQFRITQPLQVNRLRRSRVLPLAPDP
jgi:hypothetical protein